MIDRNPARIQKNLHTAKFAFRQQHVENRPSRTIAEKLTQRLFMPGYSIPFYQLQEVLGCKERQRRFGKMRVL